jgi:hypothetical protein
LIELMTKLFKYLLIAFVGLSVGACDSNDGDEDSAADQFVGEWVLTGAVDDKGDQFGTIGGTYSEILLVLRSSGSASVVGTSITGGDDVSVDGTYSVSESTKILTLVATISGIGEVTLPLAYDFLSSNAVDLTTNGFVTAALNAILGTSLVGSVAMSFERQ